MIYSHSNNWKFFFKKAFIVSFLFLRFPLGAQDTSIEKKVDEYITPYVRSNDFAGNIVILQHGKVLVNRSYGLANYEDSIPHSSEGVFHVASISKSFTAILIMRLQETGKLHVSDNIEKFIPDFPHGEKITIHHLLSQTSGLVDYNRFPDYDEFSLKHHTLKETVDWFKDKPLRFEPGSEYGYSNANFVTLAYIIEQITEGSFEEYLSQIITKPLNMTATGNFTFEDIVPHRVSGYDIGASTIGLINAPFYDKSFKRGSGAIYTTTGDLIKLDKALYGNSLLSESSKKQMFNPVGENGYGYGWIINRRFGKYLFYEHDGKSPGFSALFSRYPEQNLTIIFLSNINSGLFNTIRRDLAAIALNEPYETPKANTYLSLTPQAMKQFEGIYKFPNGFKYEIKVENAHLVCYFGDSKQGDLLFPIENNVLLLRSRFDYLTLKKEDGKTVIEYKERGGITICPRQ